MPTLTRWFVRSALIYFVAALAVGALLAARSAFTLSPQVSVLSPVYFHLLMVGWVTQLIFGVAFWMFPKLTLEQPRGSEALGWATYWLLNLGLLLRVISEPLNTLMASPLLGWLVATSAVLQWLGGIAFVVNT